MPTEILYSIPIYLIFLAALGALTAVMFFGYWRGKGAHHEDSIESLLEMIPVSLLGLLALLLGFTFSMAISRFDRRKEVMVREANAIETSWLRDGMLSSREALRDRTPITGLFVQSVNEMIDLATERQFAANDHVPELAYIVIFLLATACLYCLGYVYGFNSYRWTAPFLISFVFSVVMAMILDIDRPSRGLIRVDTKMMSDLYESLQRRGGG